MPVMSLNLKAMNSELSITFGSFAEDWRIHGIHSDLYMCGYVCSQDHLLEEFYAWMQAEQSDGKVEFSIKKNVSTHGHILNSNIA